VSDSVMLTAREAATADAIINSTENRLWEARTFARWAKEQGRPSGYDQHRANIAQRKSAQRTAASARRRAALLRRMPAWAEPYAIARVYALARRLTRLTGIEHHVDHIIPLQGALVSGLHVHNNLQILAGSENCRKGNKYEVEA